MASPQIKSFKGINNVGDPLRLGLGWLEVADNVDITDTGAVVKRKGFTLAQAGAFTAAYSTLDFTRLYVVDGGVLKAVTGPTSSVTLLDGLADAPMRWCEINNQVFFNNGINDGIITNDNEVLMWRWPSPPFADDSSFFTYRLPDGRMTGTGGVDSDAATPDGLTLIKYERELQIEGEDASTVYTHPVHGDLLTAHLAPLPEGADCIQAWRGRIYAAQYFPEADQSAVWFSQPLGFHLFNLDTDFVLLPGRVLMLAPHDSALIIGTDKAIHAYTGEALSQLAAYGVVPGCHWALDDDDKRVLFWTVRGLCAGLPFTNLTDKQISVVPGVHAGGALVRSQGAKRYLVSLQTGAAPF